MGCGLPAFKKPGFLPFCGLAEVCESLSGTEIRGTGPPAPALGCHTLYIYGKSGSQPKAGQTAPPQIPSLGVGFHCPAVQPAAGSMAMDSSVMDKAGTLALKDIGTGKMPVLRGISVGGSAHSAQAGRRAAVWPKPAGSPHIGLKRLKDLIYLDFSHRRKFFSKSLTLV